MLASYCSTHAVVLEGEPEADRSKKSNQLAMSPSSCTLHSGRAVGYFLTKGLTVMALPRRGLPETT